MKNINKKIQNLFYCFKFRSKENDNGFTLVELLIVMAIIGIVAAFTVAGFNRFNQNQTLTIAVKNVKSDLALAKANASSHVALGCLGELRGYRLNYIDDDEYVIQQICLPAGSPIETFPSSGPVKKLPSGARFNGSFSIRFNPLARQSSGGSIRVEDRSNPSRFVIISVSNEGVIQ